MPSGAFYVVAHLAVAALYLLLALRAWRSLQGDGTARASPDWSALALPAIALLHGALLATAIFSDGVFRFGFAQALSATLLLAVLIVWGEGFFVPMRGLQLFVLPLAAVSALLPAVFHGAPVDAAGHTLALRVHLLVAISAYSLLTIAAMHGLLMASIDRHLHGSPHDGATLGRILREVPPLLAMERMLFRLIGAGFVLLTATVVTGVFFTESLFGRPLRFDHKTVFTIASWLVFAGLLAGRFVFGWRGRTALRWTLAGFLMLLLAYVGSRFVLEVILQRV